MSVKRPEPHKKRRLRLQAAGASQSTRQRAMQEAQLQLMRGGYHVMSMELVARRIGIRTPSLYHHFPGGKDELFLAVVEHGTAEDGAHITEAMRQHDGPLEKLRAAAHYFATLAGHHPYHAITERRKELPAATRRLLAKKFADRVEAPLVTVIEEAIASGVFRACDPLMAVRSFLMLMLSLGEFEGDDPMRRALPDFLVALYVDGLRLRA